jgi:hypothetical protein
MFINIRECYLIFKEVLVMKKLLVLVSILAIASLASAATMEIYDFGDGTTASMCQVVCQEKQT